MRHRLPIAVCLDVNLEVNCLWNDQFELDLRLYIEMARLVLPPLHGQPRRPAGSSAGRCSGPGPAGAPPSSCSPVVDVAAVALCSSD